MSKARVRHAGAAHDEGNAERWLLTYADMITLLLALFVLLFAVSSISAKKFLELEHGLTATFNPSAVVTDGGTGLLQQTSLVDQPGTNPSPSPVLAGSANPTPTKQQQDTATVLKEALAKAGLGKTSSVTISRQGVVVEVLADQLFFDSDSASFGPQGNAVVDTIAKVVKVEPNPIEVEGFTDNEPILSGPYSSNWMLSSARAAGVVNRLNAVDGIAESRLSAVGYGPSHPETSNAAPAGQARNRRIDFVVLNS